MPFTSSTEAGSKSSSTESLPNTLTPRHAFSGDPVSPGSQTPRTSRPSPWAIDNNTLACPPAPNNTKGNEEALAITLKRFASGIALGRLLANQPPQRAGGHTAATSRSSQILSRQDTTFY